MKNNPNFDKWVSFTGYLLILTIIYGLLFYLLKYSAPQIAAFIVEVSPMTKLSTQEALEHALNYAYAIDIAIFILTAIGEDRGAKYFVAVQITTTLLFMHRWDEVVILNENSSNIDISKAWRLFIGSVVFSIMAQIAIWFLSEQIKKILNKIKAILEQIRANTKQTETTIEQKLFVISSTGAKLEQKLNELEMIIAESEQEKAEKELQNEALSSGPEKKLWECKECGEEFKTFRARAGHMKKHTGFKAAQNGKEIVTL